MQQLRQYWPNQWIFILAAVGSAAGLGNLWRFPYQAFEYGGGAFVLAVLLGNILIGVPLLLLEVGIGQKHQRGAADAFGSINPWFRYLGWSALTLSFLLLTYYMAVVSWSINYLIKAPQLAWGSNTEAFFFESVLQHSGGFTSLGGISLPVLVGLVLAWIGVYFATFKSVASISRVVAWTATLPFAILAILIVRALTLDGALAGVQAFFVPQWAALADPQLWLAAFSQVFFTLSLAFGIMIAYGKFKERTTEITKSVVWVAAGNFLVSILSGIVVFGTLGYMAHEQNVALSEVIASGPALAFVVFPQAINLLPAFSALVGILFFAAFLALAVDSAFSLLEAFATSLRDRLQHISGERLTLTLAVIGFAISTVFATGAGLYILDVADHFIVNYGLVTIGLLEAVVVGWLWKGEDLVSFINQHSRWKLGTSWYIAIRYLIPLFLVTLLAWNVYNEVQAPYNGYPAWALLTFGLTPLLAAPIIGTAINYLTPQPTTEHTERVIPVRDKRRRSRT
jgi:NSS family neurotransmitter:Na+ symporter